jgi:hypothetical protein
MIFVIGTGRRLYFHGVMVSGFWGFAAFDD